MRSGARGSRRPPASPEALAVGHSIGRYVILGEAGRGATGIVYRAYDPELDRRVALKVLFTDGGDTEADRAEVLQEARALAKLRHEHVVSVYDVGEGEDPQGRPLVYVAMEYVHGRDLARWIEDVSPRRPAVLDTMARAGRGLEAAHAAGIVHCDFKASNVLVGDQGEVRVVDFGLARMGPRRPGDLPEVAGDLAASDQDGQRRSLPAGTPAYLAPELYEGQPADARSDTFSFCVTLWEALCGEPPWKKRTEMALLEAKRSDPPTLPAGAELPRSLESLLRAGLRPDPAQRPAGVQAIVAALERRSSRRRWLLGGALLLIAIAGGLWARGGDPCAGGATRTAAVWPADLEASTREAVTRSGVTAVEEVWRQLEGNVEGYLARWEQGYRDACEATHVRHEQSSEVLDRRMQCLDRKLEQLKMLLQMLARTPDRSLAIESGRAVAKLEADLACDRDQVSGLLQPSGETAAALMPELDRVKVLEAVARYDDALQLGRHVRAQAEKAQTTGIALESRYRVGRLLERTGEHAQALEELADVHWSAEAEGLDTLAAKAGIYVVYLHAAVENEPEAALAWAPHVRAAVQRAGADPLLHAALIENIGIAHLYEHDYEGALQRFERSLALRETAAGEDSLAVVSSLGNLGIVLEEMKRYDDAIAQQQRSLEILRRRVGEHHPHTARVVDNLGTAHLRKGEVQVAREYFERALQIRRSALGPEHRFVALSLFHFGLAALQDGDPEAAIGHYEEALRIYGRSFEQDARSILLCHEGLAHAYAALEDWSRAREHARTALEGLRPRMADDHPEIRGLLDIVARADAADAQP